MRNPTSSHARLRQLGVREPAREQPEDLALALGQPLERAFVQRLGRACEPLHQALRRRRAEEGVAGRNDPDRVDELGRLDVLQQEAARAGPHRRIDVLVEVERRQYQDACPRSGFDEPPCRLDPVEVRHAHVHEDHVRVELPRQLDPLLAVRRLADELEVVAFVEDHPKAAAHERLVVDDEHANRHSRNRAATV